VVVEVITDAFAELHLMIIINNICTCFKFSAPVSFFLPTRFTAAFRGRLRHLADQYGVCHVLPVLRVIHNGGAARDGVRPPGVVVRHRQLR